MDYAALRTELTTDPAGLGYAPLVAAGNVAGLRDALNLARAGVTIRRADITFDDFYTAINVADMTPLATSPSAAALSAERRYLAWLSGLAGLATLRLQNDDGTDTQIVANIKAIFTAGSGTLARLAALATRAGSRAEGLFGAGAAVTADDVSNALREAP